MISITKVTNGSYNVFGTSDGAFVLQGNLTKDELKQLKAEIIRVMKEN